MKRSFKFILVLLIPSIIILLLLGDKILLLFGRAYSESSLKLLWILAFSAFPMSLNQIYFAIKKVEMKSVIGLSTFIAISTLGMSYFLLPKWVSSASALPGSQATE